MKDSENKPDGAETQKMFRVQSTSAVGQDASTEHVEAKDLAEVMQHTDKETAKAEAKGNAGRIYLRVTEVDSEEDNDLISNNFVHATSTNPQVKWKGCVVSMTMLILSSLISIWLMMQIYKMAVTFFQ